MKASTAASPAQPARRWDAEKCLKLQPARIAIFGPGIIEALRYSCNNTCIHIAEDETSLAFLCLPLLACAFVCVNSGASDANNQSNVLVNYEG